MMFYSASEHQSVTVCGRLLLCDVIQQFEAKQLLEFFPEIPMLDNRVVELVENHDDPIGISEETFKKLKPFRKLGMGFYDHHNPKKIAHAFYCEVTYDDEPIRMVIVDCMGSFKTLLVRFDQLDAARACLGKILV